MNRGDLLFNRTNSLALVGKTGLFDLDGTFVFASYLVRLMVDRTRVLPEFLNSYLNADSTQARLKRMATRGVSQSNINASKLKSLELKLPPLAEQERIVKWVGSIRRLSAVETRSLSALGVLKTSVLDYLFDQERT